MYSLGSQLTSLAKENSKPETPKPETPKPETPKPETPKPEMKNLLPPVIPKPAPNTTKYVCPAVTSGCKWERQYENEDAPCGTLQEIMCTVDDAKNDCASWGWKFSSNFIGGRERGTFCFKTEPDISSDSCKWSDLDPTTKIKKHNKTPECDEKLANLSCARMGGVTTPGNGCFIDFRPA
jgi:hypothetical protein